MYLWLADETGERARGGASHYVTMEVMSPTQIKKTTVLEIF